MNTRQLQKLAKQGESETVEFKKSTALMRSIFETVCAFLNGKGGNILIGVNDKGELLGQDVTDNTRQELARELHKIEPPASIDIHHLSIQKGKSVIAIQVKANDHAPYVYDGRAFQRHQSTTSKMPQHRYEQLLVIRGQLNHSWEKMIAEGYKISDLDREEIFKTVADGIRENRIPASAQRDSIKAILKRLQLIEGNQLKNAAVALYAKPKSLGFMQCMIKMARFKGLNHLGEFLDNQQIKGNCFNLLEVADNFIKRNFTIASSFKTDQFKRVDTPTLPILAVREALINAICHRDYGQQGTDISVAMFDDRLEIWNSGLPPAPLKIKDLKHRHKSVLRNELIANAFYVRGFIEKWGTGINKIMDLCKADGVPQPKFEELTGGLLITFKFKELIGLSKMEHKPELTDRQKEILTLLKQSPLNGAQILNKLKDSPAIRTVQVDLTQLEKLGLIKREGKARATAWKLVKND
ncbi:MAG: putative DNA binding domain-containing protein [Proteobacteria bacterium]|nr:putative DNA binding domain-containing protein [Pseudomonadota bacterium]